MISNKFFDELFLLTLTVRPSDKFNCAPLTIKNTNSNHGYIQFTQKSKAESQKLKLGVTILSVATCFQFVHCLKILHRDTTNQSTGNNILGWFTCICMTTTTIYVFLCRSKSKEIQFYLNNLIIMHRKQQQILGKKHNASLYDLCTLFYIPITLVSMAAFVPFFVLGTHWYNPCKPSLIGYILLPECTGTKSGSGIISIMVIWNATLKTFMLIGNIWAWFFGCYGFSFVFAAIHIIPTIIFKKSILDFWKKLDSSLNVYNDSLMYRQYQVFNTLTNELQKTCLGVMICATILSISMTLSVLIEMSSKFHADKNIFMITALVTGAVTSAVTLLTIPGRQISVYTISERCVAAAKKTICTYKPNATQKWARRYWRSCNQLKIKFGDTNYLEKLTQLKCISLSLDLTIQFLLLSRAK